MKDGDIKEIMHHIGHAKGVNAFRCSKTKGHATQDDLDKGLSTPFLKYGNDQSDTYAVKGRNWCSWEANGHPTKFDIAKKIYERHMAYANFVRQLGQTMVRVFLAEKTLRERHPVENFVAVQRFTPMFLDYPDPEQARPFTREMDNRSLQNSRMATPGGKKEIVDFILSLRIMPAEATVGGISCIGAYLLFCCFSKHR